jgi:hypothetical protein
MGVDRVSGQPLYGSAGPCPSFVRHFLGPLSNEGRYHTFGPPGVLLFSLLIEHVSLDIPTHLSQAAH